MTMANFEEVVRAVDGLMEAELQRFVDEAWVSPRQEPAGWHFSELDQARVRLIVELRRDLAVEEETLPLVLSLLDRVYGLRRHMRLLLQAVEAQPPEVREAIRMACRPPGPPA